MHRDQSPYKNVNLGNNSENTVTLLKIDYFQKKKKTPESIWLAHLEGRGRRIANLGPIWPIIADGQNM